MHVVASRGRCSRSACPTRVLRFVFHEELAIIRENHTNIGKCLGRANVDLKPHIRAPRLKPLCIERNGGA
jgi:hypothetical protein